MTALYVMLAVLLLAVVVVRTPWFKGWLGELQVRIWIWWRLDRSIYRALHNVTLPTEDGTTQIDHVIVSRFGIFVIETKNMRGAIYGSERDKNWTQAFGHSKHRFQNPLRQNYKHTQTLAEILGLPGEVIHSVVVFVGNSTFKTDMPEHVTYCGGCIEHIKGFQEEVLSDDAVGEIVAAIEENRLQPGLRTHFQHVRHVRELVAEKESGRQTQPPQPAPADDSSPACPKCDSPMVLRTARRSQKKGERFWGCPRYPKCRATLPYSGG